VHVLLDFGDGGGIFLELFRVEHVLEHHNATHVSRAIISTPHGFQTPSINKIKLQTLLRLQW
jgi:hypothetical protein